MHADAAAAGFGRLQVPPSATPPPAQTRQPGGLTTREVEVLVRVARGASNKDAALALSVSEATVRRHLANIYLKLGVGSRTAAAAWAHQHGLVPGGAGLTRPASYTIRTTSVVVAASSSRCAAAGTDLASVRQVDIQRGSTDHDRHRHRTETRPGRRGNVRRPGDRCPQRRLHRPHDQHWSPDGAVRCAAGGRPGHQHRVSRADGPQRALRPGVAQGSGDRADP
jgi:DNA-binding CsgD family transcriptional regulator